MVDMFPVKIIQTSNEGLLKASIKPRGLNYHRKILLPKLGLHGLIETMNFKIYSGLGAEINCNTLIEIEAMFAKYCTRFFNQTLAFFIGLYRGFTQLQRNSAKLEIFRMQNSKNLAKVAF